MPNHFDRILKENIESLFPFLAKRLGLDIGKTAELKDKLQVTLEREPDFLKRALHDDPTLDFIFHLELETKDEADMDARELLYNGILYHKYRLPVLQFVIYIGDVPPKNMTGKIKLKNLDFQYHLIDFKTFDYQEFVQSNQPEEVVMAILANFKGTSSDLVVDQILARLKELLGASLRLQKYLRQLEMLSKLR